MRAFHLRVLLRMFDGCATNLSFTVNVTSMRGHHVHDEALQRLCGHLEALLRLTDVDDEAKIADPRHFIALFVAERFAATALQDGWDR
ncbi:hypothetical protein V8D89_001362 [Ganoderma adspersum]